MLTLIHRQENGYKQTLIPPICPLFLKERIKLFFLFLEKLISSTLSCVTPNRSRFSIRFRTLSQESSSMLSFPVSSQDFPSGKLRLSRDNRRACVRCVSGSRSTEGGEAKLAANRISAWRCMILAHREPSNLNISNVIILSTRNVFEWKVVIKRLVIQISGSARWCLGIW